MPSRLMGHLFPLSGYYGIERVIWGSLVPIVGTTNFAQKKTGIDLRGVRHNNLTKVSGTMEIIGIDFKTMLPKTTS